MCPLKIEYEKVYGSRKYEKVEISKDNNVTTSSGTRLWLEQDKKGGAVMVSGQENNDTELNVQRGTPEIVVKSLRSNCVISVLFEPGDRVKIDNVRITGT